jgi:hypothetical protein
MSETVVFSQLSRKFIDENDATPAEAQQASITAWRLVTTLGSSIAWKGVNLSMGSNIWHGLLPLLREAKLAGKWKV